MPRRRTWVRFRRRLERELRVLNRRASQRTALVNERAADLGDGALAEIQVELAVSHLNSEFEKKQAIVAALDQIRHGDYGICDACGKAISHKRLEAVPWARLCVPCQDSEEAAAREQRSIDAVSTRPVGGSEFLTAA